MATIYTNNSSRRVGEDSERIEKEWFERLGPPRGAVCNVCGEKSSDGKLVNGRCRACRPTENISGKTAATFSDSILKAIEQGESSGSHQHDY